MATPSPPTLYFNRLSLRIIHKVVHYLENAEELSAGLDLGVHLAELIRERDFLSQYVTSKIRNQTFANMIESAHLLVHEDIAVNRIKEINVEIARIEAMEEHEYMGIDKTVVYWLIYGARA